MKASYKWLYEYCEYKDSPEKLAEDLTNLGLEVTGISYKPKPPDFLTVGEIKKITKHPNADKLSVTQTDVGGDMKQIICGASNIYEGQKVLVALPGCTLPGNFKIKEAQIRGVPSSGMICSKEELGLEEKSAGIWELPQSAKAGEDPKTYTGDEDWIFDIDLTSNRGDCMSIIGIAREISAMTAKPLKFQEPNLHKNKTGHVSIKVNDKEGCLLYSVRRLTKVKTGPSPAWMVRRLSDHGIRSINNIVDITNYVLLEYGQPLHAFDYNKIENAKIIVRRANAGETLKTLDENKDLSLTQDDLVICDSKKPLALAGIMGGEDSGVTDETTEILLEAAWFDPKTVRRTGVRHNITSDSQTRFEKGIDPEKTISALNRACNLICQYAGGEIISGIISSHSTKLTPKEIPLKYANIEKKLGIKIPNVKINDFLTRLKFEIRPGGSGIANVLVPLRRHDINYEWDLIEEIARLYGYNNIPEKMPRIFNKDLSLDDRFEEHYITLASLSGFHQVMNFSFFDKTRMIENDRFIYENEIKALSIANPLSSDFQYLRTTLLYGLLKNIKTNSDSGNKEHLRFFEYGRVFQKAKAEKTFSESKHIGFIAAGQDRPANWITNERPFDFYDLSGITHSFLQAAGFKSIEIKEEKNPRLSPAASGKIYVNRKPCGIIGLVNQEILEAYGIETEKVYYAEIDLGVLDTLNVKNIKYKKPSPFPAVKRDIALVMDEKAEIMPLYTALKKADPSVSSVSISNIYKGKNIGTDKKSVVFSIHYTSEEKTLTKEDVDKTEKNVLNSILKKFPATPR